MARRTFPPSIRRLDPRYMRTGAALSAIVLLIAILLGWPALVAIDALLLGTSALLGTRFWLLCRPWPMIRKRMAAPMVKIEPEVPYRFSQAGATVLLALAVVLVAVGANLAGWAVVAAVAIVQAIHAVTGFSLGARLYALPWVVPDIYTAIALRTTLDPGR
jgi:Domain of unknown function (DUF4395)